MARSGPVRTGQPLIAASNGRLAVAAAAADSVVRTSTSGTRRKADGAWRRPGCLLYVVRRPRRCARRLDIGGDVVAQHGAWQRRHGRGSRDTVARPGRHRRHHRRARWRLLAGRRLRGAAWRADVGGKARQRAASAPAAGTSLTEGQPHGGVVPTRKDPSARAAFVHSPQSNGRQRWCESIFVWCERSIRLLPRLLCSTT